MAHRVFDTLVSESVGYRLQALGTQDPSIKAGLEGRARVADLTARRLLPNWAQKTWECLYELETRRQLWKA